MKYIVDLDGTCVPITNRTARYNRAPWWLRMLLLAVNRHA